MRHDKRFDNIKGEFFIVKSILFQPGQNLTIGEGLPNISEPY